MFWWLALVTFSRLDSVAKIACSMHISQFLNVFIFSLEYFWLFIVFPISNLSKTHCVSLKEPPFLHLFNFKSPRKRYGFFYPQSIFHVFNLVFLILWDVVGAFELYGFRTWVYSFVGFGGLETSDFSYEMLNLFDIILGAPILSILTNLCWLVNFIPIRYVFRFSVIYSECKYGCFRMILLFDL